MSWHVVNVASPPSRDWEQTLHLQGSCCSTADAASTHFFGGAGREICAHLYPLVILLANACKMVLGYSWIGYVMWWCVFKRMIRREFQSRDLRWRLMIKANEVQGSNTCVDSVQQIWHSQSQGLSQRVPTLYGWMFQQWSNTSDTKYLQGFLDVHPWQWKASQVRAWSALEVSSEPKCVAL